MKENCVQTFRAALLLLAVAMLSVTPLHSQDVTASLRGTVLDPSGAGVPRAQVTAVQVETGLKRAVLTDARGAYTLLSLPLGHYRLEVSAKGFHRFVQEGITLSVNEAATVPVHLEIGSSTQVAQVRANASLIQTSATSLGMTVSGHEILDLPLNGRRVPSALERKGNFSQDPGPLLNLCPNPPQCSQPPDKSNRRSSPD
jgi:Carboxypeptidase regulatory-like domain